MEEATERAKALKERLELERDTEFGFGFNAPKNIMHKFSEKSDDFFCGPLTVIVPNG